MKDRSLSCIEVESIPDVEKMVEIWNTEAKKRI